MYALLKGAALLVVSIWLMAAAASAVASELPAGSMICVRLLEPVSSDGSSAGDIVHGMLAVPVELNGRVVLPARTPVTGRVTLVRKVGLGFRRDRAALNFEISGVHPEGGNTIPIQTRVAAIENARESAAKDGRILGTIAADVPQVFFTLRSYQLPVLSPVPAPIRLLRLAIFPFFPQPEIRLPRGTDVWVSLKEPVEVPEGRGKVPARLALDSDALPKHVFSKKGKPADLVNLVFVGSEQELDEAFERAGWDQADQPTWQTSFRAVRNVFAQRYDPKQPMSRMMLNGRVADRQYQRGLNTYSKRHHLRVWRTGQELGGKPVWVGAATHDIGVKWLWKRFQFTHAIDPKIDVERTKIAADLAFSGCVMDSDLLPRSMASSMRNAEGARIETDGNLLAVRLRPCDYERVGSAKELAELYKWRMGFWKRTLQRQVLIVRNDFIRLNVLWNGGRLGKRAVYALARRNQRNPAETMIMPSTRWSPGTENVLSTSIASVAVPPPGITGADSSVKPPVLE